MYLLQVVHVLLHAGSQVWVGDQAQLALAHADLPHGAVFAVQDREVLGARDAELGRGQVAAHPVEGELAVCARLK